METRTNYISKAGIDIIKQNISKEVFNIESIITYLENHDVITNEIFYELEMLNDYQKNQTKNYLTYYRNINRETFIKRIPIYFYDYSPISKKCSINDFFLSYFNGAKYDENMKEAVERKMLMLENIIYYYGITLDQMLGYLYDQGGKDFLNYTFEKWYEYLELIGKTKEHYFPNNVLTGLNYELKNKRGKEYIFSPEIIRIEIHDDKAVKILGLFPTNSDGSIIFDWVGLWTENITKLTSTTRNEYCLVESKIKLVKQKQPMMINEVTIEVNTNSKIYVSKEQNIDGSIIPVWHDIYRGINRIEYDYKLISYYREKMRISQKDMSNDLNINLRTFQRFEAGETKPDAFDFIRIMKYLRIEDYEVFIKKDFIADPNFKKYLERKRGLQKEREER